MNQKLGLESLSCQQLPSLNNLCSYSTLQESNHDMINKILQLQTHLYKVHMQSQQLRQKRMQLQNQLQSKKQILKAALHTPRKIQTTSRPARKSRRQSEPTLQIQKIIQSQLPSTENQKQMRISLNSRSKNLCHSISSRQINFDSLKHPPIRKSFKISQVPEICNTTKATNLSNSRSIGIKKNIPSKQLLPPPQPEISQDEDLLKLSNFKSIEEIWNNTKNQSRIQKIPAKGSIKKKSYLH